MQIPDGGGVLYDVTRLIARRKARTPTGIDRVDLRYALRAAAFEWGPAMLVTQLGGRLVEVPPPVGRRLLDDLADRWLEGRAGAEIDSLLHDAGLAESAPPERLSLGAKRVHGFALENHRAFYMNTSHHGIANPEVFAALHGRLGGGFVFFVHDLIPIDFPEYVRPGEKATHEARMATVLSLGATLIVNSEATRQAVEHWAAEHGYPCPRTHVARIGIEPAFQAPCPAAPPLDEPYFVCVSTIEPRKNHITLLHVWRDMARSLPPDQVPKLVLIGRRGWECEHVLAMLDRCDLLRRHVIELSALSDAQMRAWVQGARAALFPSFAEGWGMPVVEALALGVPVICSDIAVFREATQGHAEFLGPLDAPAWRERILAHAAEPAAARALRRARLQGFVPPRWEEHFATLRPALFRSTEAPAVPAGRASWFRGSAGAPAMEAAGIEADETLEDFAGAVLAGDQARDRGNWTAAARAYRRALEFEPENAGIRIQFGHMAKEAGFLNTAYEAYCGALERIPADADLHLQLGHLFKLGNCLPQALAYYEAALALDPASGDALQHAEWVRHHLRTGLAA